MVRLSTNSRRKGHCFMCGTTKGNQRENVPFRVQRKLGRARRFSKQVLANDPKL